MVTTSHVKRNGNNLVDMLTNEGGTMGKRHLDSLWLYFHHDPLKSYYLDMDQQDTPHPPMVGAPSQLTNLNGLLDNMTFWLGGSPHLAYLCHGPDHHPHNIVDDRTLIKGYQCKGERVTTL